MNHDLTSIIDPHAGRYNGSDPAAAKAFLEVQRNFQQLRPDPVIVIAGPAMQPGHYYALELQGAATSDGVSMPDPDYGLQRSDNVIVVINTLEQSTGTHWLNSGTTAVGSRRINQGTAQAGIDSVLISIPFNYAGTNLLNGGTGGMTNTGGFGGPVNVDGTDPGDGFPPPPGTIPVIGGGGPGGGFGPTGPGGGGTGSGPTGGGGDGSCPLQYSAVIAGVGAPYDGTWTLTWDSDSRGWIFINTDVDIGLGDHWYVQVAPGPPGGDVVALFSNFAPTYCPPNGAYDGSGGQTCTITAI